MVIYSVQAGLFLLAYFLRFESDLLIVAITSGFFVVAIALFQIATRTGWRLRNRDQQPQERARPGLIAALGGPSLLSRLSYAAIAVAVGGYAVLIVIETATLRSDFRVLVLALLALLAGCSAVLRGAPLSVIEKATLYVTATVLVYIESVLLPEARISSDLGWAAVAIAAVGTAVRLRLYNDRRFQLTPLDLIVLFMALVVPSLPGSLHLPHGGALAIAKLVILFYAIEMLASRVEGRPLWLRVAAGSVLAGLAVRPLLPL